MLGWDILIHKEHSESTNELDWRLPNKDNVLATWQASLGGDDWLIELVEMDKAKCLGGCGYPIRYLAKVKDVLPLIQAGPPTHRGPLVIGEDYVTPRGWVSDATINLEMFNLENPDSVIVIDTWDLS